MLLQAVKMSARYRHRPREKPQNIYDEAMTSHRNHDHQVYFKAYYLIVLMAHFDDSKSAGAGADADSFAGW